MCGNHGWCLSTLIKRWPSGLHRWLQLRCATVTVPDDLRSNVQLVYGVQTMSDSWPVQWCVCRYILKEPLLLKFLIYVFFRACGWNFNWIIASMVLILYILNICRKYQHLAPLIINLYTCIAWWSVSESSACPSVCPSVYQSLSLSLSLFLSCNDWSIYCTVLEKFKNEWNYTLFDPFRIFLLILVKVFCTLLSDPAVFSFLSTADIRPCSCNMLFWNNFEI